MGLVLKEHASEKIIIEVSGDLTFSESTKFREMLKFLETKKTFNIVVDLEKTEFIDSAALGMLLMLKETADEMSADVEITGASGQVLQVLELSRFHDLFTMSSADNRPAA